MISKEMDRLSKVEELLERAKGLLEAIDPPREYGGREWRRMLQSQLDSALALVGHLGWAIRSAADEESFERLRREVAERLR